MHVRIEYCTQWNYEPQAVGLAAELGQAFPGTEFELVKGSGGVFEVTVGDHKIFSKKDLGRFPAYQEIPLLLL